ncbi:membrane-bound acyltransferase YfiQ involved in biofilm formation [Kineothrix alysoides]|uniref:Membrane-bound acyltransferase YfiQ involved in biofilm formation n=1 Tax=Kineothrix alysoides TaxID=1469948 RepID=A0A4R1R0P5_9FIRM|nr:acyltransferase [Kineothrix alysoides]TCL58856.1 membrane-bound acyltransferase YfiQ involved in biofilm formation [Kineothrix alysoides]
MKKKEVVTTFFIFIAWCVFLCVSGFIEVQKISENKMSGWLLPALLMVLLFYGSQKAPAGGYTKAAFSLKKSKAFQGFLAVCVIMHHMYIVLLSELDYKGALIMFKNSGVIIVGFFFFASGYGLITSLYQKDNYLKGFIKKRIFTVLVPFFICNYVYLTTMLLMGRKYAMSDLLCVFFGVKLLNSQMWFAVEIMFLYILFYVIFRFIRREKVAYMIMGVCVVAVMGGSLLLGHDLTTGEIVSWFRGEWWYNTTFVFFIGMLAARFKEKLLPWIKKRYYLCLSMLLVLSSFFGIISKRLLEEKGYWIEDIFYKGYTEKIETLAFQLPMVVFSVAVILLFMMKITFYNKALDFFGRFSLEVILINNVFIVSLLKLAVINEILYIIAVFAATILAAMTIYKIKLWVLDKNDYLSRWR